MEFIENRILEPGPGVFVRNAVDNATWADLGDGVVVIDTLEDPALAPVIQQCIAETVGKPVRWVVNTHWHPDHIAGNPFWAKQGATVIAHESVGLATPPGDGKPDLTFSDRHQLHGAERTVDLQFLGGTHTKWDSVVYFPWAKVLHIADLFGWGMIPFPLWDEKKAPRLRQVLRRVMAYDAKTLIPGHGPLLEPKHVQRWLLYFNELLERVPSLVRAGKSLEETQIACPPPKDMKEWWRFTDWKHEYNVRMLWEGHR